MPTSSPSLHSRISCTLHRRAKGIRSLLTRNHQTRLGTRRAPNQSVIRSIQWRQIHNFSVESGPRPCSLEAISKRLRYENKPATAPQTAKVIMQSATAVTMKAEIEWPLLLICWTFWQIRVSLSSESNRVRLPCHRSMKPKKEARKQRQRLSLRKCQR